MGSKVPVTTTVSLRGSTNWAQTVTIVNGKTSRKDDLRNLYYTRMNWNDAAEDFLNQVLGQTPYPVREQTEANLRAVAEAMAEDEGKNRVGVETVIAAWVRTTPEVLRPDLPRQMEKFGLDPEEYGHLL
jgi:hypothetical protein